MTLNELISELQFLQAEYGETVVRLGRNSGDYWRTEVADEINEVYIGDTKFSEYHQTNKVLEEATDKSVKSVILHKSL